MTSFTASYIFDLQDKMTDKLKLISVEVDKFNKKVYDSGKLVRDATGKMNASYLSVANTIGKMGNAQTKIQSEIEKVNNSLNKVGEGSKKKVKKIGDSFDEILKIVSKVGIAQKILSLPADIFNTFVEYDKTLSRISAVSGLYGENLAKLSERIREFSKGTTISAEQNAKILDELIRQTGDVETAFSQLKSVNLLTIIGDVDVARASQAIGQFASNFHLQGEEIRRAVDQISTGADISQASVDKILTAATYTTPVFSATNRSFAEMVTAVSLVSNRIGEATTVGTGLAQVFERLIDPTKASQQALEDAGLTMDDINIKQLGFRKVLENLQPLKNNERALFKIFETIGSRAIIPLLKNLDDYDVMLSKIEGSTGSAEAKATTMTNSLQGSLDRMNTSWTELKLALSDGGFLDVVTFAIDTLKFSINGLADGIKFIKEGLAAISESGFAQDLLTVGNYISQPVRAGDNVKAKQDEVARDILKARGIKTSMFEDPSEVLRQTKIKSRAEEVKMLQQKANSVSVGGDIVVRFENPPPNTKIDVKNQKSNVNLGYQLQ